MKKGYITVFFALVFVVIVSFVLSIFEGLKVNATRLKAECGFSIAANSVLGEYHKELLEKYDLFYVDTSYKTAMPSYHYVEAHLWDYLEKNFGENVDSVELTGITLATDGEGAAFQKQISDYMKDKIGLSYIEQITELYETVSVNGLLNDSEPEDVAVNDAWTKMLQQAEEIPEETWEKVEEQYSFEENKAVRNSFTLELVLDSEDEISKNAINSKEYVSQRERIVGTGEYEELSLLDKIYLMEYAFEKFSSYPGGEEQAGLNYEMEYLLCGKDSDYENLSSTVKKILLIREGANILYLVSDAEKMNLINEFSITLASAVCCPEIEPIIAAAIVGIWAYVESVIDVKELLHEGKVPLIKTSENFHTDLESAVNMIISDDSETKSDEGMDYKEYLRLLVLFSDNQSLTYRCMDLMEMHIRQTEGNEAFRMDGCAEDFCVNIVFDIHMFGSYQIVRKFGFFS